MVTRSPRLQPPTVFDRLLDLDPDMPEDPQIGSREQLKRHRESVRRDLEILMNTQQPPQRLAAGREEIGRSLLQYGAPGFHGLMLATRAQHLALAKSLQDLIEVHETRLKNVRVALSDDKNKGMRALHLRVKADLKFDDTEETVVFDTLLDPATRQFRIGGVSVSG